MKPVEDLRKLIRLLHLKATKLIVHTNIPSDSFFLLTLAGTTGWLPDVFNFRFDLTFFPGIFT